MPKSERNPTPPGSLFVCAHHTPTTLEYLAWHAWADARQKRGDRQKQCPTCKRWFYPEEMGAAREAV